MSSINNQLQRLRRTMRTRSKLNGTALKPRLSVTITNRNVTAQLIDDVSGKTLAQSNSMSSKATNLTDKAVEVGEDIAAKANKLKIKSAIFDRGRRQYHGRMKALADAVRSKGLEV